MSQLALARHHPEKGVSVTSTTFPREKQAGQVQLVESFWQLYCDFYKAELTELSEAIDTIALTYAGQTREQRDAYIEYMAVQKELTNLANESIATIVTRRLITNDRSEELLSVSDSELVMLELARGETITRDALCAMTILRPIVHGKLASLVRNLSAVNVDLYSGFWQFASAVTAVAADGLPPHDLISHPVARADVFRRMMTREAWRNVATTSISQIGKLDPANGSTAAALQLLEKPSITATQYAQMVAERQPEIDAARKQMIAIVRDYFTKRARGIWPATKATQ